MWSEYGDKGLMVVTLLTSDAENNVADSADCADWADAYGSTHPILADEVGFSWNVMDEGYGYPFYMLVDHGMVIEKLADGEGSISKDEIVGLL